jgi:hypothetical protein
MRRVPFQCADSVVVTTCRQCYQQPVQLHCCINERYQTEKELQHHPWSITYATMARTWGYSLRPLFAWGLKWRDWRQSRGSGSRPCIY